MLGFAVGKPCLFSGQNSFKPREDELRNLLGIRGSKKNCPISKLQLRTVLKLSLLIKIIPITV